MPRVPRPRRAAGLLAALLPALLSSLLAAVPLVAARDARAQGNQAEPAREAPPIRDNSFLLEEAYNQERGVVQHISAFLRVRDAGGWTYTFTQEWPVFGQRHQLSYTLPVHRLVAPSGGRTGIGDVALNYRYQAAGGGEAMVALAPRLTLVLPTGAAERGLGAGAPGLQVNLPVSVELSRALVTHVNAGATVTPRTQSPEGFEATTAALNLGQSLIWLARPALNVMLEALWTSEEEVVGADAVARARSFFLSPGIRGAFNFPSGLQVVPGLALPFGLGPSRGERALFLYLSFEHPF